LLTLTLTLTLALSTVAAKEYTDADLGVSLDYSRFSIEGGVYLDVYLMIPRGSFTYEETESGYQTQVVFQAALLAGDVVPYPPDRWQRIYRASSKETAGSLGFVPDISKFYVEAGDYILQVDILDVKSNRRQRIRKPVSLELFPGDALSLSDLTIASQIVKTDRETEFTKYGHDIVPNAERVFSLKAPMLYYYFEAYGLSDSGSYQVQPRMVSLSGEVVKDFPVRTKRIPGTSVVEWGGINTSGLKSGIHELLIIFTDLETGTSVKQKKTFYILRAREAASRRDTQETGYMAMNEAQLNDIFALLSIVMNEHEKLIFQQSNLAGKQKVLTTFWQRKDPDPETAVNEFKVEFYNRVQLANREFGTENSEGWKSDRGRVLIQYGQPNNIERNPSGLGERPWETWQYYNIEGGVEFVFIDRTGYGHFQLVHSTAENEIQDYSWQRFLK